MNDNSIERYGVDIILNNIHQNPHCEHGPTVLFERFSAGKSSMYYACSACRNRKLCPFYQPYNIKKLKSNANVVNSKGQAKKTKRMNISQVSELSKYFLCISCVGVYSASELNKHSKCEKIEKLDRNNVKFPTKLLIPKENAKFEAQYLFNDRSTKQILKLLKGIHAKKVLCIGSPRIFEFFKNDEKSPPKCLLLDIDERFHLFYSSAEYLKCNLFNHHLFDDPEAISTYRSFIKGKEKLVLLMDPPFGGRMELIANTLSLIEKEWKEINGLDENSSLSAMLVFPYFNERIISKNLTGFSMLDYQVDYDNHPYYTTGPKGMKNGSAVRIFVNMPPEFFPLPEKEGYKLCKKCNRWVHTNNVHCYKCQGCMSKDGQSYEHCDTCGKCVKSAWIHCQTCNNCRPKGHNCSKVKVTAKCHICGAENHKRKECPKRKRSEIHRKQKKRKLN